jgi:predicted ester cyclase
LFRSPKAAIAVGRKGQTRNWLIIASPPAGGQVIGNAEVIFTETQKGDLPGLPTTGRRFSVRGRSFGEFENGKKKARRDGDYWDSASLTKQLVGEQK